MNRRTVFGLLLFLLLIIFLVQNVGNEADLEFLFLNAKNVSLTVVILISTLIGVFLGLFGPKLLDFMYESRKEKQEKEKLKEEIASVAKTTAEEVLQEANLKSSDPTK